MKKIACFLLLLICLPFLGKLWIFVDFKVHQSYIAHFFCVKKEIAQNSCQGKCQFSKRLKNAEEKEEKQNITKKEIVIDFYYHSNFIFNIPTRNSYLSFISFFYKKSLYQSNFIKNIDQPPRFCV